MPRIKGMLALGVVLGLLVGSAAVEPATRELVNTDSPQTLSNKTLVSPVLQGNVGIGTLNPDSKVSVLQNTPQDGLVIQNSSTGINATLFGITAPNDTTGQANLIYATSGGLPRFWARTDGRIFMGPPNVGGKILSVNGDILMFGCLQNTDQTTTYAGTCSSDARLKRNILPLSHALDKLAALHPVRFEWKEGLSETQGTRVHYGLIAQELERVLPELVSQQPDGYKSVNYGSVEMQMLMIQAIKELKTANDKLHHEIEALKAKLGEHAQKK